MHKIVLYFACLFFSNIAFANSFNDIKSIGNAYRGISLYAQGGHKMITADQINDPTLYPALEALNTALYSIAKWDGNDDTLQTAWDTMNNKILCNYISQIPDSNAVYIDYLTDIGKVRESAKALKDSDSTSLTITNKADIQKMMGAINNALTHDLNG